jgi:hypothetical protein
MRLRIASGFNKRVGYSHWNYDKMTAIPVNTSSGQVIGLDLKPASDGSGNYVLVVTLDNASIDVGTVDINTIYNLNPPVLDNGQSGVLQSDIHGNLKVTLATSSPDVSIGSVIVASLPAVAVESLPSLPAGSHTIGAVNQGAAGSSAWKVDPSGVTSPVSLASLPPLTAITPGSSSTLEASHILKASAGNLYSLYVISGSVGGFLMTFNDTSVPADGSVTPIDCVPVPANSIAAIGADGSPPDHYPVGIVAVFSTTGPFIKTASTTAFFKWSVK